MVKRKSALLFLVIAVIAITLAVLGVFTELSELQSFSSPGKPPVMTEGKTEESESGYLPGEQEPTMTEFPEENMTGEMDILIQDLNLSF